MREMRGSRIASAVALAVLMACSEGDGDARQTDGECTGESPILAFDHETTDPNRGIGGGVPEVSVVIADGGREMITGDWVVSQADFAPDGGQLVVVKADGDYESSGPRSTALWVIGTDGIDTTDPRELTGGDVSDEDPDWSPDGTTIVFNRIELEAGTFSWRIMTVPAEGGEPSEVLDEPIWSPDRLEEPTWSPDGTRLAFTRSVYTGGIHEETSVWTMATDGSGAAPLVTLPYVEEIDWHPDGTSLLVDTGDGAEVVDVRTGTAELLSDRIEEAVWSPDGGSVYYFEKPDNSDPDRAIRRSRVEDGRLVATEDVVTGVDPSFGLTVGPCG
ncbi:MAG TPA: hypothetical protein VK611_01245 [Acidimicrobiales bacterium]|nr:hypothetical protein [Acidimicrobiales bacterium]